MRTFNLTALSFLSLLFILSNTSCTRNNKSEKKLNQDDFYDGPEQAARMEFEHTKDPATGRVPRELLLSAIAQTKQSKESQLNSPNSVNALTWAERGPNSDVPGASNGNTRANSGIASGRIRAIMVDSNDATHKTVFIGGMDGGLWKTTDITTSPANWILVNDYRAIWLLPPFARIQDRDLQIICTSAPENLIIM